MATTITHAYAWSVDGVSSTASTSDTLPASATERVKHLDGDRHAQRWQDHGPSGSDDQSIGNTTPVVSDVIGIDPDPATAEDVLLCTWSFSDDDGDSDASTLEWTVNGAVVGTDATLSRARLSSGMKSPVR